MRIRCLDLETSADADPPNAGVCEIGWCDLIEEGGVFTVGMPQSILVNPESPISPAVSAIHHLVDADVAGAPSLAEAWPIVAPPFEKIDAFAAHFSRFDQKFLTTEYTGEIPWLCSYKAAIRLWPDAPAHKLGVLRYWLKPDGLDRELAQPAHRAGPDAYVTAHVLREIFKRPKVELAGLIACTKAGAVLPKVLFGKHANQKWADVPSGYLEWCLDQKEMDEDVKFTAAHHLRLRRKTNA